MTEITTVLPVGVDPTSELFMRGYFKVDPSGRIVSTHYLTARAYIAMRNAGDQIFIGEADPDKHWFDGQALADRPEAAVYLDVLTLRGLTLPAYVTIDGQRYECTDTEVELVFSYPGKSNVAIECFPEKVKRFEIENPS